jgi:hypothetical protein
MNVDYISNEKHHLLTSKQSKMFRPYDHMRIGDVGKIAFSAR